jgi:hypothetical protein
VWIGVKSNAAAVALGGMETACEGVVLVVVELFVNKIGLWGDVDCTGKSAIRSN